MVRVPIRFGILGVFGIFFRTVTVEAASDVAPLPTTFCFAASFNVEGRCASTDVVGSAVVASTVDGSTVVCSMLVVGSGVVALIGVTEGKAAVSHGTRSEAERDVFRRHEHGLWATLQRDDKI